MTPIPAPRRTLDPELRALLARLGDEGWELWTRFEQEVREREWHAFVPAEYDRVLVALEALWRPGMRFLELGSATGIIAVMADLVGYEAYGIELDERLVRTAREVAARYGSRARFALGSYLPQGYVWRPRDGDGRLGTVGEGRSAYPSLGLSLDDFDLVYAYPWGGEEGMILDLVNTFGDPSAGLLMHLASGELRLSYRGRVERTWRYPMEAPGPANPVR